MLLLLPRNLSFKMLPANYLSKKSLVTYLLYNHAQMKPYRHNYTGVINRTGVINHAPT